MIDSVLKKLFTLLIVWNLVFHARSDTECLEKKKKKLAGIYLGSFFIWLLSRKREEAFVTLDFPDWHWRQRRLLGLLWRCAIRTTMTDMVPRPASGNYIEKWNPIHKTQQH